ncbi:MAG: NAD(P)/FAD-dependent oxidoreductase [Planctomycetota bacterium]
MSEPGTESRTVIIGGGLTGLAAARHLEAAAHECLILCAGTEVGGRVRTDRHETDAGTFLLDRGFQVYLDAYAEAGQMLDLDALELKPFYPGALVRIESKFHKAADPFRKPIDAVKSFGSPIASLADKARLGLLDQRIRRSSIDAIWQRHERTTIDALTEAGFGEAVIERFFRPFFGGVFFDRSLQTSSRMFEFTYNNFATGNTCVPAAGMGAIPKQLASTLRSEIRLNTPVSRVNPESGELLMGDGSTITTERVILATDANAAAQLLGEKPGVPWNETATVYYDADPDSVSTFGDQAILVLDGDGIGPVNHLCVISAAAPGYAPDGRALVCANVVGKDMLERFPRDDQLDAAIREQMVGWLGEDARSWKHLATYRIPHALPRRVPGERGLDQPAAMPRLSERVVQAGDHLTHGSIEGAMIAGRLAAETLLG